jgi:hypothetical protein
MKLSYLGRGLPGYPLHPPLTHTYVHGMRVLNLVEEPATRAAAPVPHEEKVRAEEA